MSPACVTCVFLLLSCSRNSRADSDFQVKMEKNGVFSRVRSRWRSIFSKVSPFSLNFCPKRLNFAEVKPSETSRLQSSDLRTHSLGSRRANRNNPCAGHCRTDNTPERRWNSSHSGDDVVRGRASFSEGERLQACGHNFYFIIFRKKNHRKVRVEGFAGCRLEISTLFEG